MLRAVVPVTELARLLLTESPKYVGKSFPKVKRKGAECIVIEVLANEGRGRWRTGFHLLSKGPLEFDGHLEKLSGRKGVRAVYPRNGPVDGDLNEAAGAPVKPGTNHNS